MPHHHHDDSGHHDHSHRHDPAERFAEAQNVTWVSVAVNVVLTVLQIVIGIFGKSQALVADGMHSLSDLLSDFLVLYANRHSAKHADSAHPYGHGRIETATTLALGVILMGTGAALIWGAAQRLQEPAALQQVHVMTLWIALLTLFGKESLFHYMRHVARKLKSRMLEANAWHARGDAASSLVVVAGIGGNLAGITSLDLLAAAIVAAMIFRMGWKQAYSALMELIDTGLDEQEVAAIRQTLLDTPGVLGLHELRTRRMGDRALVDAHVLVEPRISVSEGHYIAETARARVVRIHDALDVMVHVDPEDDAQAKRIALLPSRDELIRQLESGLSLPGLDAKHISLHYLEGRVEADILVEPQAVTTQLFLAAQAMENQGGVFARIHLRQEIAPN
jgi:cation diffusion facilitator family transporter